MKLLFISMAIEEATMAFPLAVRILKAELNRKFSEDQLMVDSLDLTVKTSQDETLNTIISHAPDVIGFSVYLWNREETASLAAKIKEALPEIILIAGGPDATANPHALMDEAPMDYLAIGEGEELMTSFCSALIAGKPPENIPGLWKRGDLLPPPTYIADPGAFPSPFLTIQEGWELYPGLLWETSRGCPFQCTFCYESRGSGNVRSMGMERIEAELKLFAERGVEQIFVLDPAFNVDKNRAVKVLEAIINIAPEIHYTFEIKAEYLEPEIVEAFSHINVSLQLGLQSSRPEVLKKVKRRLRPELFKQKCDLLNEYGVPFGVDLIYGLPEDSLEGFKESLDYALSLEPSALDIFPLAVLPGTELGISAKAGVYPNFKYLKGTPYTIISTETFPLNDLKLAAELTEGVDEFFNKGRASTWYARIADLMGKTARELFQGYANWRIGSDVPESIEERQITYLMNLSPLKDDKNLAAAVESLIRLHQGLHMAAEEGASSLQLNHNPDQLDLLEEMSLTDFAKACPPEPQEWFLELHEDGFHFIPVEW